MNRSIKVAQQVFLLLILTIALTSCLRHTVKLDRTPSYPVGQKIPLHVELRLTESFRNSAYVLGLNRFSMGEGLSENAKLLAEALFERVSVSTAEAMASTEAEAVLIPRLVEIMRTTRRESETLLDVEWLLRDPAGEAIWIGTIRGESRGSFGNVYTFDKHLNENFDMASYALFRETYERMSSSPEIRNYANQLRKSK